MTTTSTTSTLAQRAPWHARVTAENWRTLFAAFVGWGFDGYETYALIVVVVPALATLGTPSHDVSLWAGVAIGTTLFGWAIGGIAGGVAADYVGRKRIMMISILAYSVLTGLTALSQSYLELVVLRFLTGLTLGSEWSTGTALIAETWPEEARAKGAGFMQSGFGFGSLLASLAWFLLNPVGGESWRLVFLVGIIPAFFTLYLRARMPESDRWKQSIENDEWSATERDVSVGTSTRSRERPATIAMVLGQPVSRQRALLTLIASLFSIGAWYAASTALPLFVAQVGTQHGVANIPHWTSLVGIIYNIGAIGGYVCGGFFADSIGRKPYLALYCVMSLVMIPVLYLTSTSLTVITVLAGINGFFTLGIFAAFAIYLPELFTTQVRATAISFVFNSNRLLACVGPVVFGSLVGTLGGPKPAALIVGAAYIVPIFVLPFLPETKGAGLPA